MSLKIFETILIEVCSIDYEDVHNGKRRARLQIERDKRRAMKDIITPEINDNDIFESCLRSFGTSLQKTMVLYAKSQGARIQNFTVGKIKIDGVFEYINTIYVLESKTNINLDSGKGRETKSELEHKKKAVIFSYRDEAKVVSGIVVWSKATGEEAKKIIKSSLREENIFGYQEFFAIFNVNVSRHEYEDMIRRVWNEAILSKHHSCQTYLTV